MANLKSGVDKLDIDNLKNEPSGLNSLKSKVDKFDTGKLETSPVHLSKLSDVVKSEVIKKSQFNELGKKFYNINTAYTSNLI